MMYRLLFALWTLQPITLKVSPPHFVYAPATLTIEVRVQMEPTDRQIDVRLESEQFSRASGWTIDPEKAPRLYSWPVHGVPAGHYEIAAGIGPWGGYRAVDRVTLNVLSN